MIKSILSWLTFLSHIFILLFFFMKYFAKKYYNLIKKYSLHLAFLIAVISTSGSLYFSEILKYEPCVLCWYQRIFMYPLVILLGISILRKDKNAAFYGMILSFVGILLAGYHYYISMIPIGESCSANGVSCMINYFIDFGYINIPMMSLTAFILIFLLLRKKYKG